MYLIKESYEDFRVEEVPKLKLGEGDYSYFLMEKRGWETRKAVREIARRLGINEKRINLAGIKDKKAVTKQYISVYRINPLNAEALKIKDISLKFIGKGKERIKLGQIKANRFRIVVRNLTKRHRKVSFVENYYDDQRFGGRNHLLGNALIKKEFRKVCFMLRLEWKTGEYLAPIKSLGIKLLRLYINSFQSMLFNEVLSQYVKSNSKRSFEVDYCLGTVAFTLEKLKNKSIPIVGFLTEFRDKEISSFYSHLLSLEGITKQDFLIKQIPEISSEGGKREAIVPINELSISYEKDELHRGRKKAILGFTLPPGSYGTMVVKKLFG